MNYEIKCNINNTLVQATVSLF